MTMRKWRWKLCLLAVLPALTGCLRHTRKVEKEHLAGPVLDADLTQLVNGVNQRYNAIQTLSATVEIAASTGGAVQGKQTDYTSFRGYILLRKPEMLRVLGLVPVLRTRMFDLASNGQTFKLLIPPKSRAIEGSNTVTKLSSNALENLRPQFFFNSVLVPAITPDQLAYVSQDQRLLRNPKTKDLVDTPEYALHIMVEKAPSQTRAPVHVAEPVRVIRFSRLDLLPVEQDVYDTAGNVTTRVTYFHYQNFGNTRYPSRIVIDRPMESYSIALTIEKLTVNQPLPEDQFQLKIPPGIHIEELK
jgi:outer membrane lipoprotein-sorting protein